MNQRVHKDAMIALCATELQHMMSLRNADHIAPAPHDEDVAAKLREERLKLLSEVIRLRGVDIDVKQPLDLPGR